MNPATTRPPCKSNFHTFHGASDTPQATRDRPACGDKSGACVDAFPMKKTHTQPPPSAAKKTAIRSALGARTIAPTSLRPGDWLQFRGTVKSFDCCVIQSSAVHGRTEIRWPDGGLQVMPHEWTAWYLWTFIGQGRRRKWWRYLPRWLRGRVCRYTGPVRK
jgi:hypothetical protein